MFRLTFRLPWSLGLALTMSGGLPAMGLGAGALSPEAPGSAAGFRMISADDRTLVIEHRIENVTLTAAQASPIVTTWIALPPGAWAVAERVVLSEEACPWAADLDLEQRRALTERLRSEPEVEMLSAPSVLRRQTVVELRHQWLGLGRDGSPRTVSHARFIIHLDHEAAERAERASGADPFESLYRSVVLNYEQGRAWRRPPPASSPARGSDYFSSTSAPWIKIWCEREDLYAIRGADLEALNVDLASIDPLTLRAFSPRQVPLAEETSVDQSAAWMNSLAILLEGMEDGRFDPTDRILFLGHGPDAWYSNKGLTPPGLEAFARDPYANENPYWLTWDGSFAAPPARMAEVDAAQLSEPLVTRVRDRIHLEEDRLYEPRMKEVGTGAADWEVYWWRERIANQDRDDVNDITISIPDPVPSEPVSIFARLWGANNPQGDPAIPDHDLELRLNDNFIERRTFEGYTRADVEAEGVWLQSGDTQVFQTVLHGHLDPTINRQDQVNLAFFDLEYTRELRARGDEIAFFAGGYSGTQSFAVSGFQAADVLVIDATRPDSPRLLRGDTAPVGSAFTARFRATLDGSGGLPPRFVLRRESLLRAPRLERDRAPAGGYLRERTDAVQMVILTHDRFRVAAERLAAYREASFPDREAAGVAVVDVDDVFDEFSFGRRDPVAIRNFLQWIRFRWTGGNPDDGPAYLLMMGDGHRDSRGKVTANPADFVPTYTRYYDRNYLNQIYEPRFSSDDFFALLDGPGDVGMDLFIGRLSVETANDATTVVDKIIRYETESEFGPWRNRVTLVADDICQGTVPDRFLGWAHLRQTEVLADEILPETLQLDRIYLVEYGVECIFTNKPDTAADILDAMNAGTLIVNYTGHGAESQIADERVFEISSVGSLNNSNRLFLFLTASCSVGKFDVSNQSLAETLIRHPGGGAIVVFSASSVASSQGNAEVNQNFFLAAFPEKDATRSRPVGEAAVQAKLALNTASLNQRRFALHGDPAVRLLTPRREIELSLRSLHTGLASGDTLSRGAPTELTGRVVDESGQVLTDFEGTASVLVLDSELVRRPVPGTPANDYELTGVPIYRGTTQVRGGELSVRFQTPAALRTGDRGPAQIYVYADDGEVDAGGALAHLIVPEVPPPPSSDQTGPTITLELDRVGDTVGPGAAITVSFFDSSGVNITGLVPSRAVIFRIEENGEVVLAEDVSNLVTFGDDYRSARLVHRMPSSLVEGTRYEAVLEASDNLNNRSFARASFVLSGNGESGFQLVRVFNLPNPTERRTHFLGELNQDAFVEVDIFTLSGRRVTRLGETRVSPEQFASLGIGWDGTDDDGDRLSNGVYLYKVTARPVGGGPSQSRLQRLVVSR